MVRKEYFWHGVTSFLFLVLLGVMTLLFRNSSLNISFFDFFILTLVTFRLTHLLVYDKVMDFVRDYLDRFDKGFGKSLSELVHCPWCTGTWIALLVASLYFLTDYSRFVMIVLSLAGAAIVLEIVVRLIWKNIPKK